MATHKTTNFALTLTPPSKLSESAEAALDACGSIHPCYDVSWIDLFAIFRNSRRLVRETNRLDASADLELPIMVDIMREDHSRLRRLLLLVAIENLFNVGPQNAMEVLWIYGEELELADQISERLADIEQEIAQVKAHFGNVVCV